MTVVPTIESLQDSVNELRNAILEIKEGLTEFMVSQNAISNELNRMKNGEGTSNNGGSQNHSGNGNQNHRNGDRGFGRMSKTEFSRFNGDDVKGWVYRCREFYKIDGIDDTDREVYEREVLKRFGAVFDDPLMELKKLKQDGTVKDYQEKFEELLNMVELDKKHAISLFLEGLKNEIMPGHKCAGQLFSLVVLPDEEEYEENCEEETEENKVVDEFEEIQPHISLNALTGINNFQTMRVLGTVGKHVVHILVDCGSTHNFLDKNVARKFRCQMRPTVPLPVIVADGNNLVTTSECKNFKWKFGNNVFTTDVMLLPLGGCDMVKGEKVAIRGTHKSNMEWMNDKSTQKDVVQAEFHSMALCAFPANAASCMQLEGVSAIVVKEIQEVLKSYADVF
ncbi:reverse transcriptase [Tanacetum coccineum]